MKISRGLGRRPEFEQYVAFDMLPGDDVRDDAEPADAIGGFLATYRHPASIAPVGGPEDPWAAADSGGAVTAASGLRGIDVSIMPEVPTVATDPTAITIAEHLAAQVYGPRADASEAPRYRPHLPDRRRQRSENDEAQPGDHGLQPAAVGRAVSGEHGLRLTRHTNWATTPHPGDRDSPRAVHTINQGVAHMSVTELTLNETGLPVGTWMIDPTHSSASFAVKHKAVATFRGHFEKLDTRP